MTDPSYDSQPFIDAVAAGADSGYGLCSHVANNQMLNWLNAEAHNLDLTVGDHVSEPINAGQSTEVRQRHARAYHDIADSAVPAARSLSVFLAQVAHGLQDYHELGGWTPIEAGYQLYRHGDDWISPHRDRRNDQLLAVTITVTGSALVNIYEPVDDPDDYSNLRQTDQYRTQPGSLMVLRASGFGSGDQTIHEVLPPERGSRLVLNLRMRPDVLKQPNSI